MTEIEDQAVQILSNEGAQCGNCGDQPGGRNCPDCEKCRRGYVAALMAAGWAPSAPADADLRDRIAEALRAAAFECDGKCGLSERDCYDAHPINFSAMSNGTTHVSGPVTAIADAALAVLPADTDQAAEAHRLALSQALGLGTGAPWDAIREQASGLQAEIAKLIRWHKEDGDALAKMRGTIERLRAELETARKVAASDTERLAHLEGENARLRADRAAVLRQAADALGTAYEEGRIPYGGDYVDMCADELRRLADEAQQAGEGR